MSDELVDPPSHPAKYSASILALLGMLTHRSRLTLDPFAGTGRIHGLPQRTIGVEIEPEWASIHPNTVVGDALALPFRDASFDCVATSPTYGNRMADHHEAKDGSKRNTYRHTLGRRLHPNNSGQLQWGPAYQTFHLGAWAEVDRVLEPGGRFVLNISNHIRAGQEIDVCGWHRAAAEAIGFLYRRQYEVKTPRNGFGANGNLRVPYELVYLFQKKG